MVKTENTHFEIVEQCRQGDRHAQFELYGLYSKAMYNICLRMLNDKENAEDILQNSFIDVFTKLNSFRHDSTIGAWIKRIVINNCINFLKKRRLAIQELKENHKKIGSFDVDTLDPVSLRFSVDSIKEALFQLPDGYRVVFSLYALEGYDHKEIASIMNIAESTSKSQYSRAKRKLQDLLKSRIEN